jgi:hypothetical protein
MNTAEHLAERLSATRHDLYVAFVDLLGFSGRVREDWSNAARVYSAVMSEADRLYEGHKAFWGHMDRVVPATLRTISDSLVIVGSDLIDVGTLAQAIQSAALASGNMLVRGGIAYGPHSAVDQGPHSYMVSRPLAVAAGLESNIARYPRIVLDRDSGVENDAEKLRRQGHGLFMECEDGLWMVVPFSFRLEAAGESPDRFGAARTILERLAAAHKQTPHSAKYDWMLSCVDRVTAYMDELADHPDNPANYRDDR